MLTTTASYQYSTIFIQPMLWTDCTERDSIGRCLDEDKQQPGIRGSNAGLSHGSYGSYNLNRRHTLTVRSDVEVGIDRLLGSHTINAGVDFNPIWSVYDFGYIGNQLLIKEPTDTNGDGLYNPEEVNDLESYDPVARYVIVNNDREQTPGLLFNVYLQDRWRPVRGLMIQLGARYLRANLKNNIGDTIIDTSALSWGATVGWDPFRDGKTYLLASTTRRLSTRDCSRCPVTSTRARSTLSTTPGTPASKSGPRSPPARARPPQTSPTPTLWWLGTTSC